MQFAVACAGLMGATGVALAAAAAHGADAARLGPASSMLLVHAPAVLAALALINGGAMHRRLGGVAVAGLLIGTALFSGDLTMRYSLARALFPMAAPIGGTLLIASWLVLAVAALLPQRAGNLPL